MEVYTDLEEYNSKIYDAMNILRSELAKDTTKGSYYYSWQANIAMAFQAEWSRQAEAREYIDLGKLEIDEIANTAAKNFLNLLIK